MESYDVQRYVEEAASEVGMEIVREFRIGRVDNPEYEKFLKRLQKQRYPYLEEAMGDHVFNDQGFLRDMIGDYIYGQENKKEILDDLSRNQHYAKVVAAIRKEA